VDHGVLFSPVVFSSVIFICFSVRLFTCIVRLLLLFCFVLFCSFVRLFVSSFSSLSHFLLLLLLLLHMSAIVLVQAAEMLLRLLI